ncbi:TonB-dependent siderophore receptor [Pelagicoccus mobilis]|uniref:TonB-dependent receptor n=1 Tax=Pelagicoccus mobilis TaxID=415221 RepID=A0A934VJH8_9BACT|nr:TonB-dependent receptor [Pelagicoccus mobilis]MBK1875631.1 TonB-dependent receptor [Pelagicoccus mobilis]
MIKPKFLRPLCLALPALIPGINAYSQSDDKDIVFDLSPFHVEATDDEFYETTNSQAATRMSVPLKDVPFNLQVINQQLIDDTMAFGGQPLGFGGGANREAVSWSGAVEGKSVRGFNTLEFLRNGFLRYSDNGSATIEKVEIIKGPNSILDGVTKPGGVINVVTKKPNPHRDFSKFKFVYGIPLDRMVANFDFNRRLSMREDGEAFATFRLVGGIERSEYVTKYRKRKLENIMPSLTFNFTENTLLGIQHEYYKVNGERGNGDDAFGNRVNVDDPNGLRGEVPFLHYYNGNYEEGQIKQYMSWGGPDLNEAHPEVVNDTLVSFEHRFQDNLVFNLDYNYHNRKVNWGTTLNNQRTQVDPVDGIFPEDGTPFRWRRRFQDNKRTQIVEGFRGQLAWSFDAGEQTHRFVAGFLNQEEHSNGHSDYLVGGEDLFNNGVFFGNNSMEDAIAAGPDGKPDPLWDRFPLFEADPDLRFPTGGQFIPWGDKWHKYVDTTSFYLNHHTKWFNDKLTTLVGVYDASLDISNPIYNRTREDVPLGDLVRETGFDEGEAMPQVGAVYSINNTLGIYGNFSRSMSDNGGKEDGFKNPLGPKQGEIHEIGAKFTTNDGKVSGVISLWEITESNSGQWDEYAPNEDNPTGDPDDTENPPGAWVAVGEVTAKGLDADFFFYPIKNFNTVLSYGYKTKETTEDLDASRIGRPHNIYKHKISLFNKYTWADGPLAGMSANLGLTYRSKRQRHHDRFGAPAYEDPRFGLQAGVGYKWEGDHMNYKVRLTAKNLGKFTESSSGYIPGTRDAYYQELPAEYLLSFDIEH